MSKLEKKKMATSREVYDQIIWDVRLDSSAFIVGFQERLSATGIQEKPLLQWAAGGDVPWHRIRYLRCGDTIVWDREQHLDLISTGQLPAAAWRRNHLEDANENMVTLLEEPQGIFNQRSVYKYDSQGWRSDEQAPGSVSLGTLTVVSFNVLCNLYEKQKIQTKKRLPAIIEHLRQCQADIIAIQEATPRLVELLLSLNWVREYFISESSAATTIKPYGNLLLSRLPFSLVAAHKRALVGTWQINDRPLHVAAIHLTSDRSPNALKIRWHQLQTIFAHLQSRSGDSLIVGDFNIRGNEQEELLTRTGYVDVWQELHPDETGYTFDPQRNPLAQLMSRSGEPARFERILLRSNNNDWTPQAIDLFACEPVVYTQGTIYPSDYFGIRTVLKSSKPSSLSQPSRIPHPCTHGWG